ncbi:caspase b-like isoform X3 [Artemia franciscana]|uniref:caspase b-like isoform X3 n=1 Tax=Artemia franciscana TaxID=6661 RepID=UPI0032D9B1BB
MFISVVFIIQETTCVNNTKFFRKKGYFGPCQHIEGDATMSTSHLETDAEVTALSNFRKWSKPWNVDFRISDGLLIPVSGYLIVKREKLASWKNERPEFDGVGHKAYVKKNEKMTEVPANEIIIGYQYGSKTIPFSAEAEKEMKLYSEPKDFSVICFAGAATIQEYFFTGDSTMIFVPRSGDQNSQVKLSAFIHALAESKKVAIVRRVYSDNMPPKVGFLSPVIKPSTEYLQYITLIYSEDVRKITFPSLLEEKKKLTDDQKGAIDDLIDSMDLTSSDGRELYRSVDIPNPYSKVVRQVSRHLLLHPETSVMEPMDEAKKQAMKPLEVSNDLIEKTAPSLKKVAEVFPVRAFKRIKQKKETFHPPRYQEQDDLLNFDIRPASLDFYNMNNKNTKECYPVVLNRPRGHVLIININSFESGNPRLGSEKDVSNLLMLFEKLNFIVTLKLDLNANELRRDVKNFAQREDHKDYSCCFVFIMSHGGPLGSNNGQWGIVCRDEVIINIEKDVINILSNREAKHLIGKPRFIVINACRGNWADTGIANTTPNVGYTSQTQVHTDSRNESGNVRIRTFDDMVILLSSPPGYASVRDLSCGTWLITNLCKVFSSRAFEKDVLTLFRLTDEALKHETGPGSEVQTLDLQSRGMNKDLFLYPGL